MKRIIIQIVVDKFECQLKPKTEHYNAPNGAYSVNDNGSLSRSTFCSCLKPDFFQWEVLFRIFSVFNEDQIERASGWRVFFPTAGRRSVNVHGKLGRSRILMRRVGTDLDRNQSSHPWSWGSLESLRRRGWHTCVFGCVLTTILHRYTVKNVIFQKIFLLKNSTIISLNKPETSTHCQETVFE